MAISYGLQVPFVQDRPVRVQRTGGAAGHLAVKEPIERKLRPVPQSNEVIGRRIRVLLADDSSVVRQALARLLQSQSDMEVVDQAADGLQAVQMALQLQPDVVLMDVSMPVLGGIEATRRIRNQLPEARIIGLSMYDEQEIAAAMSVAGASAYLTKTAPPSQLIATIRQGVAPSCRS